MHFGGNMQTIEGLQARECRWPLEAGKTKEVSIIKPLEGTRSMQLIDFELLTSAVVTTLG